MEKSCVICNTKFDAKDHRRVTCSKACMASYKAEHGRIRNGWCKREAAPAEINQRRQQAANRHRSNARHTTPTPIQVIVAAGSAECQAESARMITDEMVATAIDLRLGGETWTLISQQLSFDIQAIQARIWKYLFEQGRLDRETVDQLWFAVTGSYRPPGYAWLEKQTGLIPVEGGTRRGTKKYMNDAPAWRGLTGSRKDKP